MSEPVDDRSAWDRIAPRYDRVIPWFAGRYERVRERLRVDLVGRARVLEIGAGTGQFTPAIAAVADRVIATDLSVEMVARLERTLRDAGLSNVETRAMDAASIDAADGAFDAAVCANVLHVVRRPELVLRELGRVLRPGGVLVAPTFCYGESLRARVALVALGAISPFRVHGRFSASSLAELVTAAGFRVETRANLGGWLPEVYLRASVPELTSRSCDSGSVPPASS